MGVAGAAGASLLPETEARAAGCVQARSRWGWGAGEARRWLYPGEARGSAEGGGAG